ncbi:cytochrome c-type biogenesis protein [Alishewanella sp. SMS8]|uniref:cytochrome c-type biogenesis protein n=1 Tax=Alishewanella sp. SMS8 TaxID=2994676 RepID=UPI0027411F63|nr:cytochrome c-type biogenesis protein [Alishewanella sp. SMS8]MDP5460114.1 cytochrome c-type biogenesis protein CcmH [Alishewanella sp. SMS8]
MKPFFTFLCSILLTVGLSSAASAAESQELLSFESEQQRQLYLKLTAELRCPQCQNQNIADSNAVVAVDMRDKTYELVQQGLSRQQVLDFMIDRYGDFVHYQPPVNRYTIWLWLAPVLVLLSLLLFQLKRQAGQTALRYRSEQLLDDAATDSAEKAKLNQQLEQIIDSYRSKKS